MAAQQHTSTGTPHAARDPEAPAADTEAMARQDALAWGRVGVLWFAAAPVRASQVEAKPDPQSHTQAQLSPTSPMQSKQNPVAPPKTEQDRAQPAVAVSEPVARWEGDERRAAAARRLEAICARYAADAPHARFGTPHTTVVFGEGDPCARIMFVGEAPGADEDRLGRPFVGRAGKLLDQMIGAMGLSRQSVYIANVLKVRPPNNATPTVEEAAACAPYLFEQIEVIAPEAIVALGLPSARQLTGEQASMRDLRGRWWSLRTPGGEAFPVLPTYHPAYLLRNYTPDVRRKVWDDLKLVLERLGLTVPGRSDAAGE